MKIGKLEFKGYAAKKPLMVSSTGAFLTAADVLSQPSLGRASTLALSPTSQVDLAVARYALEPDFNLGVIGKGLYSKDDIIDHLKKQTDFGQEVLQAEMKYCTDLLFTLGPQGVTSEPKIPKEPVRKVPDWKPVKKCIWIKLKTRALFCENTTDGVTAPFAQYRIANVHPVFKKRGFTVIALTGVDDVRNNFVPHAKNTLTVYLSGIGHGNYTTYTGHGGNHILEVGQYDPAEVRGKAIHFLSCQTAGKLGPDTVAKGAKCYAGYTENFTFVWEDPKTPMQDFLLFAKADSIYDIMMANGTTAQQAYNAAYQLFTAGANQVPNTAAATWLIYDRDHLKLHGNAATRILPYRYVKVCFPLVSAEQEDALVGAGELVEE
ncbi:MAG: hypothetical protein KBE65_15755 [Phycisphaerae bacterium]|nr:hypothetical protein [Phycisphaerae bacterium]